ncbi:hypothetical protein F0Z19_1566 [Vibrio cyclitrophicus]|nr:hypothetical protein F0Z19_1566 [Vibrio cyclitrophicus]
MSFKACPFCLPTSLKRLNDQKYIKQSAILLAKQSYRET